MRALRGRPRWCAHGPVELRRDTEPRGRSLGVVVASSLVTTFGALPVFLLGALAVFIREELGFAESRLGLAIATYFAAAAVSSMPGGLVVERFSGTAVRVVGPLMSVVALLGLATAGSFGALLAWLAVGGSAGALSQLAANQRLAGEVVEGRQGLAFGIKQSAIPAATLVGGAAVPVFGVTVGWRWAFVATAVAAVLFTITQLKGRRSPVPGRTARRLEGNRLMYGPLILLAAATGLGAGAATAIGAFVVGYVVAVGVDAGTAGWILAIGSVAGISARVSMGWFADRRDGGNLVVVALMLLGGAAAVAVLSVVDTALPLAVATALAYALGWGWPGLFNFAVVRSHTQTPAAATGVTQVGVYLGGVTGPLTFGLLVSRFGYPTAWRMVTAAMIVAAILMLGGRRQMSRRQQHAAVTGPAVSRGAPRPVRRRMSPWP